MKPDSWNRSGRRTRLRRRATLAAAIAVALSSIPAPAEAAVQRRAISPGQWATLVDQDELYLEALPQKGEGLLAFCRRLLGDAGSCREVSRVNRNPRRLLAGVRYRVPYALLTDAGRVAVLRALFEADAPTADGWRHVGVGESAARVAEWLADGRGDVDALRAANPKLGTRVGAGEVVLVPRGLLQPAFRALLPADQPARPAVTAPAASVVAGELEYGEDAQGRYAMYRLRGGEALYSAVVVRFTGRDHAEDVNALASEIARRNGIPDVTDIPVGFPVKVPLDLLLPEFLPPDDPRRLEWEVEIELAQQYRNPVRVRGLEGVTVVLDAGHGGADVGATRAGVWESVYVYDVMQRVKRALEARTLARVVATTRDGDVDRVVERDVVPYSRGHRVLTDPAYPIADSTVGVHLRWYLANSVLRHHARNGDGDRVVFVSIHADSLHPSLRGATIYVPHAAGMTGTYGKSGSAFESRREVREAPQVSFSLRERQKMEGRSRDLAEKIVGTLRDHDLGLHPFKPVRDRIFRGRRAWIPAVLRYNEIPAKILFEVCNLANDADRRLLQTASFREEVAGALVDGILAYFGESS